MKWDTFVPNILTRQFQQALKRFNAVLNSFDKVLNQY